MDGSSRLGDETCEMARREYREKLEESLRKLVTLLGDKFDQKVKNEA